MRIRSPRPIRTPRPWRTPATGYRDGPYLCDNCEAEEDTYMVGSWAREKFDLTKKSKLTLCSSCFDELKKAIKATEPDILTRIKSWLAFILKSIF